MAMEKNRWLLELDRLLRKVNQAEIGPLLPTLTLVHIEPVLAMVARARGEYLKVLLELGEAHKNGQPSSDQIGQINELRKAYEELLSGAQALQTAIERGYLEVQGS